MEAAIFDLDDTLVNSQDIHVEATRLLFARKGWTVPKVTTEEQRHFVGLRVIDVLEVLTKKAGITTNLEQLNEERNTLFLQLVEQKLQLLPGAKEALLACQQLALPVAIASSGLRSYIEAVVERFSLPVDIIVAGDEVQQGKPDPETYLMAAAALGLPPLFCVVIEDSQNGIIAANQAGCLSIAVRNPFTPRQDLSGADIVISSLNELTKEFLERLKEKEMENN